MPVGISATRANVMLNAMSTTYARLHVGDPGSAGTSNTSTNSTRMAITLTTSTTGSRTMSAPVLWENWASGSQTLTHVSIWSDASGGQFEFSVELDTPVVVNNSETFTLQTLTIGVLTLAT